MPWNHSGQCPLWPMTVAHDHGYCCLQTKAFTGVVFEGASDAAAPFTTATTEFLKSQKSSEFRNILIIILPSHFFLKINLHLGTTYVEIPPI